MHRIASLIFGNDDDGLCGDGGNNCSFFQKVKWWLRNPFHNFTHYVIGFKGEAFNTVNERIYGNRLKGVYLLTNCKRRYKNDRCYPYIVIQIKRIKMYLGWRSSGAFGVKLSYLWLPLIILLIS